MTLPQFLLGQTTMPAADGAGLFDSPVNIAELVLLAVGALLLVAGGVTLAARDAWSSFFRLEPPAPNQVGIFEVVLAAWMFVVVPALASRVIDLVAPPPSEEAATTIAAEAEPTTQSESAEPAATQPAAQAPPSRDDALPTLRKAAAGILSQFVIAVVFISLGAIRFGGLAAWGLTLRDLPRRAVEALVAYILIWPICLGLLQLVTFMYSVWEMPLKEHFAILTMLDEKTPVSVLVLTIISAVVMAPIVEEVLFRGLILPAFVRWTASPWAGVLLSGLLFGFIHTAVTQTVPALAFFGVALGFAFLKKRSLTLAILIHAIFNAKTVLWIYLGAAAPAG